ncbi:LON peptidase substrate-binding domain-containing protein [Alkalilimnicola sp. S0819]|uniref:LON peptidase substrate-binding domain-containing protein n=1 Tax=Alkalilimnicola sp. S0819 TaxID=2613922 RepID=UPI001262A737|nr:LON peptidase substrate-binding domain-containing protein [Alkalilimnicola sp. S0819]KAB7623020.1 peptidase S16 [Alkalilimnicola sp. S0819]MPQ17132.1 peptidase S16 [Alkalilimnicola sp. S0819]
MEQLPLFPLHTVLFPGGLLRLRVFEPRYLDLVRDCLRNDAPFGVCLIERGLEVGPAALPYALGTSARIIDWERAPNGLLGITVRGERRFRIYDVHVGALELQMGDIEWLPEAPELALPDEYSALAARLERILAQSGCLPESEPLRFNDAYWVGCRLAEVLPLRLEDKQALLALDDPVALLASLTQGRVPSTNDT